MFICSIWWTKVFPELRGLQKFKKKVFLLYNLSWTESFPNADLPIFLTIFLFLPIATYENKGCSDLSWSKFCIIKFPRKPTFDFVRSTIKSPDLVYEN